jgi:hypothetical protein
VLQTIAWVMVIGGLVWFVAGVLLGPKENKSDRVSSR